MEEIERELNEESPGAPESAAKDRRGQGARPCSTPPSDFCLPPSTGRLNLHSPTDATRSVPSKILWIATGSSRIWGERLPRLVEAQFQRFLALFAGNKQPTRGLREVDSWFEGSIELTRRPETGRSLYSGGTPLPASCRNLLQTAFHPISRRFLLLPRGFREADSWFAGNPLVVWGKRVRGLREMTRGLREIYSWTEGNLLVD
jgi:hypothetical protein